MDNPDSVKIFVLKPGQQLKIGKGNDCDYVLDPPREEEHVIADLHFMVGFDFIEQHAYPPTEDNKVYSRKRVDQCNNFIAQIKQKLEGGDGFLGKSSPKPNLLEDQKFNFNNN